MQKRESKIKIRNGFSERQGIYKCNTQMQVDELDDRTRVALSNELFNLCKLIFNDKEFEYKYHSYQNYDNGENDFCHIVLAEAFCEKAQAGSYEWDWLFRCRLGVVIDNSPYNEILDLLEYVCNWWFDNYTALGYGHPYLGYIFDCFNKIFEKEYVGYRFVDGKIMPITDNTEIKTIEDALTTKHNGAKAHISKAIAYLSDREKPDYKNSIKESISSVESICQYIVEDEHASLGQALKRIEKQGVVLHPSLKSALEKLYGYTSDEGGIRHAEGLTESEVTFAEAKLMLVSCCAFVNYLLEKYGK